MANVRLLFFAQVGEKLGCRQYRVSVDTTTMTVNDLIEYLISTDEKWSVLNDSTFKIAVNQTIADRTQAINDAEEIAFFPPVTGG